MTGPEASAALQPLLGLPLRCLGRAANMLWADFGETRETLSPRGHPRQTGQWALHVSCPWRLCRSGRIVVAWHDFYYSPEGDALEDWDTIGKSAFDATVLKLNREWSDSAPQVSAIRIDDIGGFSLELTNDYRLDVFPANAGDAEHWRLFEPGAGREHFVFRQNA